MRACDVWSWPWKAWVEDATGRGRSCRMILARDGLWTYPCELPRGKGRGSRREVVRRLRRAIAAPFFISGAAYVGVLAGVVVWMEWTEHTDPWPLCGAMLLGAGVYLTVGSAPVRRKYRGAHVRVLLERGRCPWCLYDLSGAANAEGGRVVCPECGGEWAGGSM